MVKYMASKAAIPALVDRSTKARFRSIEPNPHFFRILYDSDEVRFEIDGDTIDTGGYYRYFDKEEQRVYVSPLNIQLEQRMRDVPLPRSLKGYEVADPQTQLLYRMAAIFHRMAAHRSIPYERITKIFVLPSVFDRLKSV